MCTTKIFDVSFDDKFTMTLPAQTVVVEYADGGGDVMCVKIIDTSLVIDDDDDILWTL